MPPKRDAEDGGGGGGKKSRLQQKTAAEFFAENKHFAGFESPGKSLFTSIRELVENSLDAAEGIGVLPEVRIELEEISKERFRRLHGLEAVAVEEPADDAPPAKGKKVAGGKRLGGKDYGYYKLTVTDNGCGMKHDEIPKMFGTVLSGTKYGVRQERGKFGLGSKMVLIWSKMSTGLPMRIRSSQVTVTIGGEFSLYKSYTVKYLREMAVITPYAKFEMIYKAEDASKSFHIVHSRRSEIMPPPPSKAKVHPSSIDNHTMANLLHSTTKKTLFKFLTGELDCVNSDMAHRMIKEFGSSFREETDVSTLDTSMVRQMVDRISQMSFSNPTGAVLAPAGEYNLHLGVMKEMRPDMIATSTQDVTVVDGHAVIVEAAVSLGGRRMKEGINVHRFANRIPMLFQPGSDLTVKACTSGAPKGVNWKQYKIDKNTHKIGVYVSICSTKIPYGGPNKEYIGDEHEDLQKAVKGAIMSCCAQLRARLARQEMLKQQRDRRKNLQKYIPFVARSLAGMLESISEDGVAESVSQDASIIKTMEAYASKDITEDILQAKLRRFVEEADMEQAMAAIQAGSDKETKVRDDVFLKIRGVKRKLMREMHAECACLKLFDD